VFSEMNKNALSPYLDGKILFTDALKEAKKPLRKFMLQNTRKKMLLHFWKFPKPRIQKLSMIFLTLYCCLPL